MLTNQKDNPRKRMKNNKKRRGGQWIDSRTRDCAFRIVHVLYFGT